METGSLTADPTQSHNPFLVNRRYLIVDDEPFTRHVMASAFRGFGCKKLVFAGDGTEAIKKLENAGERIDFVLSDFRMPNMSGLELLKSIRTGVRGISNKTPFGLLTGYSDREIVGAAFRLDVDCFLTKPISTNSLRERLEHCLSQDRTLSDPALYKAVNVDFEMDISLYTPEQLTSPGIAITDSSGNAPITGTPLGEVRSGAVLMGDLKTSGGQLILAEGQVLSDRLIMLLRQLSEIDPSVMRINVSDPDA